MVANHQPRPVNQGHGGLRFPAGGRPKGVTDSLRPAIKKATEQVVANVVAEFQARLEARLLKNLDNVGRLADGYTKDQAKDIAILPDRQANTYLIDRLLGKPVDPSANKPEAPVTNNTLILAGYSVADLEAMLQAMRRLQGHEEEA